MPRIYQILMPLLSLFLVRVDLTDLYPLRLGVKLLKVYDGDTVLLGYGSYEMRLRFSRIDAPELGQPTFDKKRDAGLLSKKCLENLVEVGREYELKIERYDMYGRILGDLEGLSLRLIEKGCVTLYPYSGFKNENEKFIYLKALKRAKSQRVGLWNFGGYRQPMIWRRTKKKNGPQRLLQQDLKKAPYRPERKRGSKVGGIENQQNLGK